MSSVTVDNKSLAPARWLVAVLLVVALHFLALFLLSQPSDSTVLTLRAPKILFVDDVERYPGLVEQLDLHDPTLFTRAHPRGFSGVNWLQVNRQNYQATKWSEPLRWLAPAQEQLAGDFARYVKETISDAAPEPVDIPPVFAKVEPSVSAVPDRATLRLVGDLAAWQLRIHPPLPVNPAPLLLTNTEVGLMVDSAGQTLSARLVQSSGSADADQSALAFARQLWFSPRNSAHARYKPASSPVVFGSLIFQWFPNTAKTNQLTVGP